MAPEPRFQYRNACGNCGAKLESEFCARCGQARSASSRLQTKTVIAHLLEQAWTMDSAIARTWLGLWVRPGEVCRDYVQGKRKRYMNPVAYMAIASAFCLIAGNWLRRVLAHLFAAAPAKEELDDLSIWVLMLMVVPLAGIWRLLFRKSGRNLAENYVFAIYLFSQLMYAELAICPVLEHLLGEEWTLLLFVLLTIPYMTLAGVTFYSKSTWSVLWRILCSLFAWMFIVAMGMLVAEAIGLVDYGILSPQDVT